jgi:hypothetical protein
MGATIRVSPRKTPLPATTHQSAELGRRSVLTADCDQDPFIRMLTISDTTKAANVNARAVAAL